MTDWFAKNSVLCIIVAKLKSDAMRTIAFENLIKSVCGIYGLQVAIRHSYLTDQAKALSTTLRIALHTTAVHWTFLMFLSECQTDWSD